MTSSYNNNSTILNIPTDTTILTQDMLDNIRYDENIKHLIIPHSITKIEKEAFGICRHLVSITLPYSIKTIEALAFYDCRNLASITIPEGVYHIDNCAFQKCTNLTSITIPDSVTTIGAYAFADCVSLTSITIPDSVTSIGMRIPRLLKPHLYHYPYWRNFNKKLHSHTAGT